MTLLQTFMKIDKLAQNLRRTGKIQTGTHTHRHDKHNLTLRNEMHLRSTSNGKHNAERLHTSRSGFYGTVLLHTFTILKYFPPSQPNF